MTALSADAVPNEEAFIDGPWAIENYQRTGNLRPGQWVYRTASGGQIMSVLVQGYIKGTANNVPLATDPSGALFVDQYGLPYQEIVRTGGGYATMATSAVAALVVRPTTTAALEIFNGYSSGGPSLVIDRLFSHNLVAVANSAMGMYAMVTTPKTAPSSASLAITGNSGKAYSGAVVNAVSTTVVANGWYPWGSAGNVVTVTTPGVTLVADIQGRIVVPPQCSLCIHVVASTTSATFTSGASWYEYTFGANNPLQ